MWRFSDIFIVRSIFYISIAWFSVKWLTQFLDKINTIEDHAKNTDKNEQLIEFRKVLTEDEFKKKGLEQFLKSFLNMQNYNCNMNSVFYSRDLYQAAIKEKDNELEKEWRRRILYNHIPNRGNVIMYYDAYKRGFAYYSDQSIPYGLINVIAMKYVLMFRCREFFLDEQIVPDEFISPFIKLYEEEEPTNTENPEDKSLKIDVKKGPFARLKQYSTTIPTNNPAQLSNTQINPLLNKYKNDKTGASSQNQVKYVIKNKFIHLGKICNFSILSKPPIIEPELKTDTKFVNPTVFNYCDYKFWRSPKSEPNTSL